MILKLNDTYRISTDNKNVVLEEQKEVKEGVRKGEKYFTNIGYYSNFEQAIQGCIKHGLLNGDVEGLQQILDFIYMFKADVIDKMELLQSEGD
jgi:hypothetical protein